MTIGWKQSLALIPPFAVGVGTILTYVASSSTTLYGSTLHDAYYSVPLLVDSIGQKFWGVIPTTFVNSLVQVIYALLVLYCAHFVPFYEVTRSWPRALFGTLFTPLAFLVNKGQGTKASILPKKGKMWIFLYIFIAGLGYISASINVHYFTDATMKWMALSGAIFEVIFLFMSLTRIHAIGFVQMPHTVEVDDEGNYETFKRNIDKHFPRSATSLFSSSVFAWFTLATARLAHIVVVLHYIEATANPDSANIVGGPVAILIVAVVNWMFYLYSSNPWMSVLPSVVYFAGVAAQYPIHLDPPVGEVVTFSSGMFFLPIVYITVFSAVIVAAIFMRSVAPIQKKAEEIEAKITPSSFGSQ